jgi:hypothetical protein
MEQMRAASVAELVRLADAVGVIVPKRSTVSAERLLDQGPV